MKRDVLSMDVGEALKEARENRGLTIEDVAYQTGIKKRLLYKLETGKEWPPPGDLAKLAKTYQVTVESLIEDVSHKRVKEMFERAEAEGVYFCGYTGPPFGLWDYKTRRTTLRMLEEILESKKISEK